MVLVDNGSALNVCPFRTVTCLRYQQKDFAVCRQAIRAYENTRREGHEGLRIHCRAGPIKGKIPGTRHPGFLQPATWKAVDSCHRSGPLYFASESQAGESCHFYFRRFVFEQVQVIELAEPVKEYLPLPYFSDNVFDGNVPIPPKTRPASPRNPGANSWPGNWLFMEIGKKEEEKRKNTSTYVYPGWCGRKGWCPW